MLILYENLKKKKVKQQEKRFIQLYNHDKAFYTQKRGKKAQKLKFLSKKEKLI